LESIILQTHYTKIVQDLMKGFEPRNSPLGTPLNTTTSSPIYRTRKLYLKHNQKGHHIRRRVLLRTKDGVSIYLPFSCKKYAHLTPQLKFVQILSLYFKYSLLASMYL